MNGYTAMHYAAKQGNEVNLKWLLDHGGPFNQVDNSHLTAGERARHAGFERCFDIWFDAAVRQEYSFWYRPRIEKENKWLYASMHNQLSKIKNKDFLRTPVSFMNPRPHIPDDFAIVTYPDGSGVMMEWERPLMKQTAQVLCAGLEKGKSILNVGFGLGIIDSYFEEYQPANHTIIEAHTQVLEHMRKTGWHDKPHMRVFEGRWQDFVGPETRPGARPANHPQDPGAESIGRFDVVYFDTYQEGYVGHMEFLRCIARLLVGHTSRFSFFDGHCRDWKLGYEVYAIVGARHANDFGLNTGWLGERSHCMHGSIFRAKYCEKMIELVLILL
ncbi:S-adenosyl-L-methionine-dependent methyltransferase [Amylocystis lapponica]|nr:S-adenosyl-L-methionine-dependent methyltransferase [Amylocystis lapponica]